MIESWQFDGSVMTRNSINNSQEAHEDDEDDEDASSSNPKTSRNAIPFGSFVSLQHLVKVSRRNDSKTNISKMMEGTRDQEIVGGKDYTSSCCRISSAGK